MISYQNSRNILKRGVIKIKDEKIKSINSLNRILSENIYSPIHYPAGNNAAFDGYAISSKDTNKLNKKKSKLFKIIGIVAAGDKPKKQRKKKFQTIEIMTGALLPKNFDTIIRIVLYRDLRLESEYNTYKVLGLPPGPITMPDISAIDAVLDYEKNNYLFMVADPSNRGYHLFANNLSEHNKNRRAYIRWINSKGIYR